MSSRLEQIHREILSHFYGTDGEITDYIEVVHSKLGPVAGFIPRELFEALIALANETETTAPVSEVLLELGGEK
jgi:hypothetical protein